MQRHASPDPVSVETRCCAVLPSDARKRPGVIGYEAGRNLYCGAKGRFFDPCSAVCSVACLEWAWRIRDQTRLPPAAADELSLEEIMPAKEAKSRFACSGKHLGCPRRKSGAARGLQYGLSGNPVPILGEGFKGKPPSAATRGSPPWKSDRT